MRRFACAAACVLAACGGPPPPAEAIVVPSAPPSAAVSASSAPVRAAPHAEPATPAFDALVRAVGDVDARRIAIVSYREEDGAIELDVRARTVGDLKHLLERLRASGAYENLSIAIVEPDVTRITTRARERTVDLVVTDAAEAKRYLAPDAKNPFDPIDTSPEPAARLDADLDSVRPLAIVSGAQPKVMFTAPSGAGWIGKIGDRVGTNACLYTIDAIGAHDVTFRKVSSAACPDRPLVVKQILSHVK